MGTILAAPMGVVGAAVVTPVIALPQMPAWIRQAACSRHDLVGRNARDLLPPAIMLVVMAEMLAVSAGTLFAAVAPGLLLSGLYLVYIIILALVRRTRRRSCRRGTGRRTGASSGSRWKGFSDDRLLHRARLHLRRMGDADGKRRGRRRGIHVHCLAQPAELEDDERLDPQRLPRERVGVHDLPWRHGLCLRVPRAGRRRPDDFTLAKLGIETKWEMLAFVMVLIFLLGFPFEWIEICLIVLPIFGPILGKYDFSDHLGEKYYFMAWFGTLVAVNLQTSFMTPPFGATLYMKGTAPPGITMSDIYSRMYPFVGLQILGLLLCIWFPEIALWLPRAVGFL